MIAIIGALREEIDGLRGLLTERKTDDRFNAITTGLLHGREVVLCECGVGKVFAAASAAYVLTKYKVTELINIGVAGGVGANVKKLDVVVADKTVQCDFDLTACGYEKGQLFLGHSGYFTSDSGLVSRLFKLATEAGRGGAHGEFSAHIGVIATGDKFVASAEDGLYLRKTFDALACDMESAAIAQVARMFNVKFASMRTVSDGADEGAPGDFDAFVRRAADNSIRILSQYLR